MTPYHHREATALLAQAWSVMEDQPNEPGRQAAAELLRQVLAVIDPPANPETNRGVEVQVESDQGEWWPNTAAAARVLGVSRPSVAFAIGDGGRTCAGRRLWRSEHATRAEFSARPTAPARQAQPQPKTRGAA